MRKFVFSSLLGGLMLALGSAIAMPAQQNAAPPPSQTTGGPRMPRRGEMAMGTVTSVGVDRLEIKKTDGTAQTIMVTDQTRYLEGRQQIQLEDLKPGDHLAVRGRTDDQKQFTAFMVRRVTADQMARFQNGGGPMMMQSGGMGMNQGDRAFGQIVSIQGNEIKVHNRMRGDMTITVTDSTTYMKQGNPIALKDLKVGDRIFARGKTESGKFTADRVMTGMMMMRRGGGGFGGQQPPPGSPQP